MTAWRQSSRCGTTSTCVQIAAARTRRLGWWLGVPAVYVAPVVLIRDGKDPGGPVLAVTTAAWVVLTETIKEGP